MGQVNINPSNPSGPSESGFGTGNPNTNPRSLFDALALVA